jgi:hypothetical protein
MSFINFLMSSLKKSERQERIEINSPCRFRLYRTEDFQDSFEELTDGTAIDISVHGLCIAVSPCYSEDYEKKIRQGHHMYLEIPAEDSDATVRMHGEIRWVRSVRDVQKPYTQMGVRVTSVKDDSKTEMLDALLPGSEAAGEEEEKEE